MVANFLPRITLSTENEEIIDYQIPNDHLFTISLLSPWFSDIANFLVAGLGKSFQIGSRMDFEEVCKGI